MDNSGSITDHVDHWPEVSHCRISSINIYNSEHVSVCRKVGVYSIGAFLTCHFVPVSVAAVAAAAVIAAAAAAAAVVVALNV